MKTKQDVLHVGLVKSLPNRAYRCIKGTSNQGVHWQWLHNRHTGNQSRVTGRWRTTAIVDLFFFALALQTPEMSDVVASKRQMILFTQSSRSGGTCQYYWLVQLEGQIKPRAFIIVAFYFVGCKCILFWSFVEECFRFLTEVRRMDHFHQIRQ